VIKELASMMNNLFGWFFVAILRNRRDTLDCTTPFGLSNIADQQHKYARLLDKKTKLL